MFLVRFFVWVAGVVYGLSFTILIAMSCLIALVFTVPYGVARYSLEGFFALITFRGSEVPGIFEKSGEVIWAPYFWAKKKIHSWWDNFRRSFPNSSQPNRRTLPPGSGRNRRALPPGR
jgi:hypothetical protein